MARRIRPKVRDHPKPVRDQKGRIKIRMRRESSDLLQLALKAAQKQAAKEAGFKGFKSGVKSATNKAKKAKEVMLRELERERVEHRHTMARVDILTTAVERVVMAGHTSTDVFASHGVYLERFKNRRENMYRWRVVWDSNAPAAQSEVRRDSDGVDRVTTTMQRHRLHPGARIRVADMSVIWASVSDQERPTIDPMQGMRGTWYYNARRYSSHSSAMNSWRRFMHERATPDNADFMTPATLRDDDDDGTNDPGYTEDGMEPTEMTEDELEEEDCAPEPMTRNRHADSMRVRNRLNMICRNIGVRSCSFWERTCHLNLTPVRARAHAGLSPYLQVAAHFDMPLHDWDEDNVQSFIASVNNYLEQTQNGNEHFVSGLLR